VNHGHTLLTIQVASKADADKVATILERHDPIDLDQHESNWREAGWTGASCRTDVTGANPVTGDAATVGTPGVAGYAAASADKPSTGTGATSEAAMAGRAGLGTPGGEEVIPLTQESVSVGKRAIAGSSVRVRTHVVTTPVEEDVHLRDERVHVERRPADRAAEVAGEGFRERTVEMNEMREEPIIAKTARVMEEVVVRKEAGERVEHVSETARRTEVGVEDGRTNKPDPAHP
jgi:uncharacterized protein (TIGR02271 family)